MQRFREVGVKLRVETENLYLKQAETDVSTVPCFLHPAPSAPFRLHPIIALLLWRSSNFTLPCLFRCRLLLPWFYFMALAFRASLQISGFHSTFPFHTSGKYYDCFSFSDIRFHVCVASRAALLTSHVSSTQPKQPPIWSLRAECSQVGRNLPKASRSVYCRIFDIQQWAAQLKGIETLWNWVGPLRSLLCRYGFISFRVTLSRFIYFLCATFWQTVNSS